MKKRLRQLASSVAFGACLHTAAVAQLFSNGKGDLRVMTYNANEGTDLLEVQAATNPGEFLAAVVQTITQVRATDPPARMQALAKQMIAASPDLVGLQELDQWATAPLDLSTFSCGATTIEFDMLQELQDALRVQGAPYTVAVKQQQYAFPPIPGAIFPSGPFLCVQMSNQIAILARTDPDSSKFQVTNPQSAQYAAALLFQTPTGAVFPFPRAWASVDASFHGKSFRFITTHLESVDTTPRIGFSIREVQGAELRSGPAKYFVTGGACHGFQFASGPIASGCNLR